MATYPLAPSAPLRGAQAYRTVDAQSRSPLELVVMLYDGAIRFVQEARDASGPDDRRRRAAAVSKALAIVCELQNTLNLDEGDAIAGELDRLYDYIKGRVIDATAKRDAAALDEVQKLLGTLRDGWSQASSATAPARP